MILSKRVALGGVQLDQVHERIVIRRIDAGVPHEEIQAVSRMGGAGQRVTGQHWETLDVTVGFAIDVPKTNMALRMEIFESVVSWAMEKGWLTVGHMPDRRMWVEKVILPSAGDVWDWTAEFRITFRSYGVPFWQDAYPTRVSNNSIQSGRMTIGVRGQVRTVIVVSFKNNGSAAISDFSVNAGGSTIILSGIGLAVNETLEIFHTEDGLLKITAGGRNVFGKRTAGSADDLYVTPGSRYVDISTSQPGKATLSCYGRYA